MTSGDNIEKYETFHRKYPLREFAHFFFIRIPNHHSYI